MDDTMTAQLLEELEAGATPERIELLARVYDDWADEIFDFAQDWWNERA